MCTFLAKTGHDSALSFSKFGPPFIETPYMSPESTLLSLVIVIAKIMYLNFFNRIWLIDSDKNSWNSKSDRKLVFFKERESKCFALKHVLI